MRIFFNFILIISIFSTIILSQDINELYVLGEGIYLPNEIIARRDINGNRCAALIILTDLKELTYDSFNGVIEVNKDFPGKHVVYLSPDERNVEVYSFGYRPLKINLNDYGIILGEGKAWQLEITAEKQLGILPVSFFIYPENSELYVDDIKTDHNGSVKIGEGRHSIKVQRENYQVIDTVINVDMENVVFRFSLSALENLPVSINSFPSGARVFLDDNFIGETNFTQNVRGGRYNLKIVKSDFITNEQVINIEPGKQNVFNINLVKNTGTIQLELEPQDCEVRINNQFYPDRTIELKTGNYELDIRKNGFTPQKISFDITAGEIITKKITLIKNSASLKFDVQPREAKLTMNNVTYDPAQIINVAPGEYEIELRLDGYESISEKIVLRAGENLTKTYRLLEQLGNLEISCQPFSTSFTLMRAGSILNEWQGSTTINSLHSGTYTVIAERDGFKRITRQVRIIPNQTVSEQFNLEQGYDYFNIDISSDENLDILIDGRYLGNTSSGKINFPAGKHLLSLEKNKEVIYSNSFNLGFEQVSELNIKNESSFPQILESALFPGLGQLLNDKEVKGGIISSAFTGSLIYYFINLSNYNKKVDELDNALNTFNNSDDATLKYNLGLNIPNLKTSADDLYNTLNMGLYICAGIYILNLVDAVLFNTPDKSVNFLSRENAGLETQFYVDNYGIFRGGIQIRF